MKAGGPEIISMQPEVLLRFMITAALSSMSRPELTYLADG